MIGKEKIRNGVNNMKCKCIIIEGPQGCGKTTLANYLRENVEAANLYRLTGNKDKTITGIEKSIKMYEALLNYMKALEGTDVSLIFDRTFFTEQVYAKLGYKEYSYDDVLEKLVEKLSSLEYDIHYISLYLKDVNIYGERIKRVHHNYQAFSLQNSVDQQNEYEKIAEMLEKNPKITVHKLAMDDFDKAYEYIDSLFGIERIEHGC